MLFNSISFLFIIAFHLLWLSKFLLWKILFHVESSYSIISLYDTFLIPIMLKIQKGSFKINAS